MKNKRSLLIGSYSIGITAVVIALVIAVNLLVGQLPTTVTKPDTTPEKLATVGEDSKKLLESVDVDVTVYRVFSETYTYTANDNSKETIPLDVNLKNLLDKYTDACPHITVKEVDPVSDPAFLEKYQSESLTQNSLVFESEKRSICINPADMFMYELEGQSGVYLSSQECYEILMQYYYSTGSAPNYTEYFFAENEITRAIDYVTSDEIPVIYSLTGHGESLISSGAFGAIISDENTELKELSLMTGEAAAVPEDAAAILIYAPTADLSEAEKEALISYAEGGGDILYFSFQQFRNEAEMPNFDALCAYMGLEAQSGVVAESERYVSTPTYIVPVPTDKGIATCLGNSNLYTYAPESHSIKAVENAENVILYPLLETTDKAYFYTEENAKDPAKAENQTFAVAYQSQITDSEGNEGGSLYWFATPFFVMDDFADYGNGMLFREMITKTCEKPVSVSIIGKPLTQTYLQLTEQINTVWTAVLIGVIPAVVLIAGLAVWFRRRRR